jgi:uncharacterized damage-inducible protein DinB
MKRFLALAGMMVLMVGPRLAAQATPLHPDPMDGLWQGYDGEWRHVSNQLIALAEATPADKFAWRPAPGVRSTSEVYMHIVLANFYLLSVTGPPMPPDLKEDAEKTVTSKPEVFAWLKRSLEAVRKAHAAETPADLARRVKVQGRDSTVDAMYLRIIIHDNEHMGQLVAAVVEVRLGSAQTTICQERAGIGHSNVINSEIGYFVVRIGSRRMV